MGMDWTPRGMEPYQHGGNPRPICNTKEGEDNPELAIVYDFDGTLIDYESTQPMLEDMGLDPPKFWQECDDIAIKHQMDSTCAYLMHLCDKLKEHGKELTPEYEAETAKRLKLRDGFEDWLGHVEYRAIAEGFCAQHYIISSGLAGIVEQVPLIKLHFKKVFGSKLHRRPDGVYYPSQVINYTNKTRYMFRISKGLLDESDEFAPNRKVSQRQVPFKHMIFIGDGFTDVPCFALLKEYGGYPVAVLGSKKNKIGVVEDLVLDDRVDFISLQNHFMPNGVLTRGFDRIMYNIRRGRD